jgi:predicted DNA-binding transcriptional regulator AlpA
MKPNAIALQSIPRLLVRLPDAASAVGIAPRTFQRQLSAGEIGPAPIKLGGTTLFNLAEMEAWANSRRDGRLPTRAEWAQMRERGTD